MDAPGKKDQEEDDAKKVSHTRTHQGNLSGSPEIHIPEQSSPVSTSSTDTKTSPSSVTSSSSSNSSPSSSPSLFKKPPPIQVPQSTFGKRDSDEDRENQSERPIPKIFRVCKILNRLFVKGLIDENCRSIESKTEEHPGKTCGCSCSFFPQKKKRININEFWRGHGINISEFAEVINTLARNYEKYKTKIEHVPVKIISFVTASPEEWEETSSPGLADLRDVLDAIKANPARNLFFAFLKITQDEMIREMRRTGGWYQSIKNIRWVKDFITALPEHLASKNSTPRPDFSDEKEDIAQRDSFMLS